MHLSTCLETGLRQGFEEPFPIRIVFEDRLLPITPIHDVINRSGVFDPKFSGPATQSTQSME
jgi:hypothetical protein